MSVHVLAIPGSLRGGSSNSAIVHAATLCAPDSCIVTVYDELGLLPPFNPDIDIEPYPEALMLAAHRAAETAT